MSKNMANSAKNCTKWIVFFSKRVPFVHIERFEPKMYLFDSNSLQFRSSEPIRIDVEHNRAGMEYDIYSHYYIGLDPNVIRSISIPPE